MDKRWENHYTKAAKLAAEQKNGSFFIIGMLSELLKSEISEAEKVEQSMFLLNQYSKERGFHCDSV